MRLYNLATSCVRSRFKPARCTTNECVSTGDVSAYAVAPARDMNDIAVPINNFPALVMIFPPRNPLRPTNALLQGDFLFHRTISARGPLGKDGHALCGRRVN